MRLRILGGSGAWPTADQGCSGYLLEHEGFRLLLDPGYATFPALLRVCAPGEVDAVLVSHGHPDHCADLNPLLRARHLDPGAGPWPALPVHAPPGALDAVLALDRPGMLAGSYRVGELADRAGFELGPFRVDARLLPHHVPNAGLRIGTPAGTLAYTGDTGPSPVVAELAEGADLLLAEATFCHEVSPASDAGYLSTAEQAGRSAAAAGVGHLVLTHLWPGTAAPDARAAARLGFDGPVSVAAPGQEFPVGR